MTDEEVSDFVAKIDHDCQVLDIIAKHCSNGVILGGELTTDVRVLYDNINSSVKEYSQLSSHAIKSDLCNIAMSRINWTNAHSYLSKKLKQKHIPNITHGLEPINIFYIDPPKLTQGENIRIFPNLVEEMEKEYIDQRTMRLKTMNNLVNKLLHEHSRYAYAKYHKIPFNTKLDGIIYKQSQREFITKNLPNMINITFPLHSHHYETNE